jgi:hypothetical protein
MTGRKLMWIAWPGFIAACALQAVVFALVDPLELEWAGHSLGWSRQAVYAAAFAMFWLAGMLSSALTALLGATAQEAESRLR